MIFFSLLGASYQCSTNKTILLYFCILGHTTQYSMNTEHFLLVTLLQGLTQVEEIAAVMPIISIYRLPHGHMVIQDLSYIYPRMSCHLLTGCHDCPQTLVSWSSERKVLISLTVTFMSEGLWCIVLYSGWSWTTLLSCQPHTHWWRCSCSASIWRKPFKYLFYIAVETPPTSDQMSAVLF